MRLQLKRLHLIRDLQLQANAALRALSKTDRYKAVYDLLISVPGVGLITAMLLITEIIDMRRFANIHQLCSYVGYIPTTHSSADNDNTGNLTRRANQRLRTALVESSWAAIRSDTELLSKYVAYKKRMTGQQAIVRIARILLRRIKLVWLSEQRYQKAEA